MTTFFATLRQDIRIALRGFRNQPGFVLAVVVSLSLGIGANTAMFSVVNAVILNPLVLSMWKNPDRVVMLWEKNPALSLFFANQIPARPRNYRAWKEQSRSFQSMTAWRDSSVTLTDIDQNHRKPEQVEAGSATSELLPLLGIRPRLGRNFTQSEVQGGKGQVAILSDELYRSRFNSNTRILGSSFLADGKGYQVIGVLPPGVSFPAIWGGMEQQKPKLWTPLDVHPPGNEDEDSKFYVLGRLRDGVTLAAARADMHAVETRLAKTGLEEGGFGINVVTLKDANTDSTLRRAVLVLQVAVLFVLLIACANAGNLLLTRGIARDKEWAVRSAIGASGARLLRQTLTESTLLSCGAAVIGLLLAFAGLRVLSAIAPPDAFALHELRVDRHVLAFTAAAAVLSGVLFGLVPALHFWKKDINEILNRSSRSVAGSSQRLRGALVTGEVALSLVLVIGAGLMVRSLSVLMNTDLGFQVDHLLVMRLQLPSWAYPSAQKIAGFNNRLLESVRTIPGVQSAALTTALPMKSVAQSSFEIPGRSNVNGVLPVTDWARVSDRYFETLHMPILKGRTFTREEAVADNPTVAVVNRALVKAYFPHAEPIGQVVTFANEQGAPTKFRIVGVIGNEHQMGPDNAESAEMYLPGDHLSEFYVVARTQGDPLRLTAALKQQVWNIDKDQPVYEVMTEQAALSEWSSPRRFNLTVLLSFAGIAVVLAALGLYSLLAYTVTLLTREIGIRMAIGAQPKTVALYILRRGLTLSGVGILIGIAVSVALTRFMATLIYGVDALDPATFITVTAVLIAVAIAASYLPALRASKVDPMEALRTE